MGSSDIPVASLYYSVDSPWSLAALLTLEEKGYGPDEVVLKSVDTATGHNFSPEYLRLNTNATLPTLVVPLQKTLGPDIESRYKAVTETKKILEFLDKSRSAQSHTHTTSLAPAPSLTPATIALSSISSALIDLVQSDKADPDLLPLYNPQALVVPPTDLISSLTNRVATLKGYLSDADQEKLRVSEKVKALWRSKLEAEESLLQVFTAPNEELKSEYLDKAGTRWNVSLKEVLTELNKEIVGPYALGDQLSLADIHLIVWLARVVKLTGGLPTDDGNAIVSKIESRLGCTFVQDISVVEARRRAGLDPGSAPPADGRRQSRLAALWDSMKERESWKKVYGAGLH